MPTKAPNMHRPAPLYIIVYLLVAAAVRALSASATNLLPLPYTALGTGRPSIFFHSWYIS